jgi:DNA-binding CsgD family transcriptional regulator
VDEHLRRAYQSARNRGALVEGISYLQRLTRFPRSVIVSRAAYLGLAGKRGERWSTEEILTLREIVGSRSLSSIAHELGRSYYSVKGQIARLQLCARVTEGYSCEQLQRLLGVSRRRVRQWIALRWVKPICNRIPEQEVARFLRRHPQQYQLNRVDEAWFKGLVFPAFNSLEGIHLKASRSGSRNDSMFDSRYVNS